MRRSKKLLRQRASADDETWLGVNHDGDPVKEVNRMDSVDDNSTMKDIKQSMSSSLEKDSKPVCPYLHVSPPTNPLSIKEEYWEEDDNSTMKDEQSMSSSLEKDSKPVCSLSSLSLTDSLKSLLDNAGLRFHLTSDGKVVLLSYYLVSKPY